MWCCPRYRNMSTANYRFADKVVEITSIYPQVHMFCKDYLCNDPAEIHLAVTREDIDYERQRAQKHASRHGVEYQEHPPAYLEALSVYRKLAEQLPRFDRILIHGSAIKVDGEGYLFTAPSGTGKSTHTRLWRELFGKRAVMINDDKPLLHITPEGATVYGSPWAGKHFLHTNTSAPLKAICFLEQAEKNEIRRITAAEAFNGLFQQSYRPKDREALLKTMELLETLSNSVGLYRLQCNMAPEAASIAYREMA